MQSFTGRVSHCLYNYNNVQDCQQTKAFTEPTQPREVLSATTFYRVKRTIGLTNKHYLPREELA